MVQVHYIDAKGVERSAEAKPKQTVMEVAVKHNIPGIVAECGGACACATCHVYVDEAWADKLPKPSNMEADMLDFASDVRPTSRLSCQITLTDDLDGLIVRTPARQG